jgi:hypothetical protein
MRTLAATLIMASTIPVSGLAAADAGAGRCSTSMLAGRWVFATDIGHQNNPNAPAPGDITAIGTMNIVRSGELEGSFDVTFEGAAFVAAIPYSGTVTVNDDCTGTLSFVTAVGSMRSDSIVVLSQYEFWGMSQDPNNLWTYRARRLPGPRSPEK